MDRSDQPTEFRGAIRGRQSRATAYVVAGAVALVVGLGILASTLGDATGPAPTLGPDASGLITAASPTPTRSPRPSSGASTPRPSPVPTPTPTPPPTLAPTAAPVTSAGLSPTGVLIADTGDQSLGSLVPDADGTVWVSRGGALVNVNPQTGGSRQWTIADDVAFTTSSLVASREGGVWLLGADAIRLFDGERFRAVIALPATIWSVVEAPDGSLWASTEQLGLIRWRDGRWTAAPPGRTGHNANGIVFDEAGRIWTGNYDLSPEGNWIGRGVSVWDGRDWTSYDQEDGLPGSEAETPNLYPGADGSVWAVAGIRLARYAGAAWAAVEVPDLAFKGYLATVDAEDRLWFTGEGCDTCPVRINMFDGSGWTEYDDTDGLPSADEVGGGWATLLTGPGYVLAATEAGLYRLAGQRWRQIELARPPSAGTPLPARVASLAAVSRSEAWAVTQPNDPFTGAEIPAGLFRFDGTAWRDERLSVATTPRQVMVAPDGVLWMATDAGPMVRRGGRWIDLGRLASSVVPDASESPQGEPGCGAVIAFGESGVVYYAGPRTRSRVVALVPSGTTWDPSLHSAPRISPECPTSMAVTHDGTVWILQRGWGSILSRSSGDPWENVQSIVADRPGTEIWPAAIAVDRDGSLWAAGSTWNPTGTVATALVLQLVGDEWVVRVEVPKMDYVSGLAFQTDRSLVLVGNGVARADGSDWRRSLASIWFDQVSIAPDGAVWVTGQNVFRLPPDMP